jgi:hypothetical protein
MPEPILRLFLTSWNGFPVAAIAIFAIGGFMALIMNRTPTSRPSSTAIITRRPGWMARRRARGGVHHPKAGAIIGYSSAFRRVGLSPRELALGGLVLGAPGSGKTTALAVLIEALAWQGIACVVLDPKPSKDLAEVVDGVDGLIWSLGGDRQWDALPADPTELSNQLVEVLPVDARTKVYRDAARLWVLVAGQALQRQGERPTVQRMAALCRPGGLAELLKSQGKHMADLPRLSQTEMDGVLSMGTSLSILARGVAGNSLGSGADTLRLSSGHMRSTRPPRTRRGYWRSVRAHGTARRLADCWVCAGVKSVPGRQVGRHARPSGWSSCRTCQRR